MDVYESKDYLLAVDGKPYSSSTWGKIIVTGTQENKITVWGENMQVQVPANKYQRTMTISKVNRESDLYKYLYQFDTFDRGANPIKITLNLNMAFNENGENKPEAITGNVRMINISWGISDGSDNTIVDGLEVSNKFASIKLEGIIKS